LLSEYRVASIALGLALMRKSATLNLRVSVEFKKRLMAEAAKENRSVTNYLEATLLSLWEEKTELTTAVARKRMPR